MRPVERGPAPTDANGVEVIFGHYRDARNPLIERIGDYCSYCEIPLPSGPDVEHIQPKSSAPDLEMTWANLLLACTNCNSIKGDQNVALSDYYWSDVDNTFRAFEYRQEFGPRPAAWLNAAELAVAQATIRLTGLDRFPGHPSLSERDRRWLKRREVWNTAVRAKQDLTETDTLALRRWIVESAIGRGFWSIWVTEFSDDADMVDRLNTGFLGTSLVCFDAEKKPVRRQGGSV